jgi:hypothetical protein
VKKHLLHFCHSFGGVCIPYFGSSPPILCHNHHSHHAILCFTASAESVEIRLMAVVPNAAFQAMTVHSVRTLGLNQRAHSILVVGECSHCFHMHCLFKWIAAPQSNQQCPMDRRPWVTAKDSPTGNDGTTTLPSSTSTTPLALQF